MSGKKKTRAPSTSIRSAKRLKLRKVIAGHLGEILNTGNFASAVIPKIRLATRRIWIQQSWFDKPDEVADAIAQALPIPDGRKTSEPIDVRILLPTSDSEFLRGRAEAQVSKNSDRTKGAERHLRFARENILWFDCLFTELLKQASNGRAKIELRFSSNRIHFPLFITDDVSYLGFYLQGSTSESGYHLAVKEATPTGRNDSLCAQMAASFEIAWERAEGIPFGTVGSAPDAEKHNVVSETSKLTSKEKIVLLRLLEETNSLSITGILNGDRLYNTRHRPIVDGLVDRKLVDTERGEYWITKDGINLLEAWDRLAYQKALQARNGSAPDAPNRRG